MNLEILDSFIYLKEELAGGYIPTVNFDYFLEYEIQPSNEKILFMRWYRRLSKPKE